MRKRSKEHHRTPLGKHEKGEIEIDEDVSHFVFGVMSSRSRNKRGARGRDKPRSNQDLAIDN
jgi:hypothetical protein